MKTEIEILNKRINDLEDLVYKLCIRLEQEAISYYDLINELKDKINER